MIGTNKIYFRTISSKRFLFLMHSKNNIRQHKNAMKMLNRDTALAKKYGAKMNFRPDLHHSLHYLFYFFKIALLPAMLIIDRILLFTFVCVAGIDPFAF